VISVLAWNSLQNVRKHHFDYLLTGSISSLVFVNLITNQLFEAGLPLKCLSLQATSWDDLVLITGSFEAVCGVSVVGEKARRPIGGYGH
jgi:hypothetical protein